MMSLLVAGLSDESVAHYLGISRRTLQRRLTRLMKNAKVDTRLQLVWRATSEGWLEPSSRASRTP
jgi:DNA-binding NarL/FixJ family response regulator